MKWYHLLAVGAVVAAVGAGCSSANKAASSSSGGGQSRTAGASAQSGGGSGGGFGAFAAFRESHKYTFMLTRMVGNIGKLDTDTEAKLTPAQAKQIMAVLTPLKTQPKLTQDQAKDAIKKLKATLTEQQLTEIGKMKQPTRPQGMSGGGGMGGPGGMRGGGMGGPGGSAQGSQGGQSGQRRRFDPSAMKDFNPFNPGEGSPMGGGRSGGRLAEAIKAIEAKANQAK